MKAPSSKISKAEERALEGGIEWIVARQLAPIQEELLRLRAYVEALREASVPW
ncbi:hypothetical protein ACFSCW_09675 [Sphingomonas tabacisoli]|uniref:Uncharacterized protein n=1 Tax=Sphingomonas tabacisoli TaxID=2249466 RepID=A0ABW4I2J5_9SPHN